MNLSLTANLIGLALLVTSGFMLFPLPVSFIYGGGDAAALAASFLVTFVFGSLTFFFTRGRRKEELGHRDGFVVVSLSWVIISLFACLPYLFSGVLSSLTDAYFEAMAGLTTTGASVIKDIEAVPKGVLFWRSLTQWMGGMGILLFAIAVLPLLGTGGIQLFKAEVPEITVDKLRPRIIDTAKSLWYIYVFLTASAAALYTAGGMNLYDAVNHAFTTLATGGFSTKNASLAHYENPFIQYTAVIFMFLAGVNYSLHFFLFRGNLSKPFKNSEFRFYLAVTLLAVAFVTAFNMAFSYGSFSESLRYASFQVVSLMTTTGYATADYELWHPFSQVLLVILMFSGGMIGSTGGGMKQVRILLMFKQIYRELHHLIHPRAVTFLKLDGKEVKKEVLGSVWGFLFLFLLVYGAAVLLMSALGIDIVTSASSVVSALSNVGPALGDVGPTDNYASLPLSGKWILTFCMLAGRLEIYTVIILFVPLFWKK